MEGSRQLACYRYIETSIIKFNEDFFLSSSFFFQPLANLFPLEYLLASFSISVFLPLQAKKCSEFPKYICITNIKLHLQKPIAHNKISWNFDIDDKFKSNSGHDVLIQCDAHPY